MELDSKKEKGACSIKEYVLPEAFTVRMKKLLGAEFDAFIESYERESVQALRLNPLKYKKRKLID